MKGEHGKIDKICPSFVTTFKPRKRSPGLTQMISMKKNIYIFVLFFFSFFFFVIWYQHLYIAHGMIMKLQTLIICSVASLFAVDTIFFIFLICLKHAIHYCRELRYSISCYVAINQPYWYGSFQLTSKLLFTRKFF